MWLRSRDTSPIIGSDDGRSISRNVASLNVTAHDVINVLYYNTIYDEENIFLMQFAVTWCIANFLTKLYGFIPMPMPMPR